MNMLIRLIDLWVQRLEDNIKRRELSRFIETDVSKDDEQI